MSLVRRAALAASFLCILSLGLISTARAQTPVSGQPVPVFAPLDTIMENLMSQYSSPGAALAISYNGKLVYARGYGYAEVDTKNPVQPDTIMRWASNSKPLTAIGIYKLIEAGKLKLTDKPFVTIFTDLAPPSGTAYNTELNDITIEELLLHTGGWDDTEVPDPIFEYEDTAAQALGDPVPATPKEMIEYMMGQPLQHSPGTTYAYSNLGYIVLGQVISKVSAGNYTSYETYMQNNIFNPYGMGRLQPAQTFLNQQLPNEAAYYDYPGAPLEPNVYDPSGPDVPEQYGGYSLPLNHANGGWAGAAIDVVREWDIMNGQITPAIINNPSAEIHSSNYFPTAPVGEGYIYTFFGSLPGTNSLVHLDTTGSYGGNLTFGAVFNTRNGDNIEEPESDATSQISTALQSVKSWPTGDLFATYPGPGSACKFSLNATSKSFTKSGGTGTVTVTDANYCAWLSFTNDSWIHVTSGAMNSNAGSMGYSVDANTGSSSRTGTISIANMTYTITEAGGLAVSTTKLTAMPNPVTVGQSVTLKATVAGSSGTPTGSVAFTVGGTTLATVSLNGSGVASLTASTNGEAPGTYPIIAKYSGSTSYADSSSTATNVVVNKAPTSTALTASPTSVTPPANVTLTATVKRSASGAAGTPTGTVTFYADGSVALATVKVGSGGVAKLTASSKGYGAGGYPITAKYTGDSGDAVSTSSSVTVTVK
jgi:N-acyl-D-amino-acid deacylase